MAVLDCPNDSPHQRLCSDTSAVGVGVDTGVAVAGEAVEDDAGWLNALVAPQAATKSPKIPAAQTVFPSDLMVRSW
ncbi:MAG: hypothetical protein WB802_03855 [Candidatus Dormiibacterota bacterium]